jgi:hypothetical protein
MTVGTLLEDALVVEELTELLDSFIPQREELSPANDLKIKLLIKLRFWGSHGFL